MLANCYRNSLALAEQHGLHTIAFPAISTGAYGFPLQHATTIAVREARAFLKTARSVRKIIFVCFGSRAAECYTKAVQEQS